MPQHSSRVRRAAPTNASLTNASPTTTLPGAEPDAIPSSPARALHSFSQIALTSPAAPAAQFKLSVNTPGDTYEQEADATADQVMRMSLPSGSTQLQREDDFDEDGSDQDGPDQDSSAQDSSAQYDPSQDDPSQYGPDDGDVQRKPLPGAVPNLLQRCAACDEEAQRTDTGAEAGEDLATADVSGVVSTGLASGGRPLDPDTRSFMEPRFGHDFSKVRIHDNASASSSAQSVAARAYTVGSNIAFRSGEFAPGSGEGRRLLAHELTHVVQQGQAAPLAPTVQRDAAPGEDDAQPGSPAVPAAPAGATGIPQLSTPANDALGVGLGVGGMLPGPLGKLFTLLGGAQSATQGPTDPSDPHYAGDKFSQNLGLATTAGSLLGVEAAGPLGLVGAGGMALGHGAEWLGDKMIEGGIEKNPGQFGPDPFDMR